mmetsp:Transcript_8118/g.24135  ORF Transcript_8118/g.24135 Transcript_8118/m.24135 type:complete len:262 (-) Transcript_8118:401-1186(-)
MHSQLSMRVPVAAPVLGRVAPVMPTRRSFSARSQVRNRAVRVAASGDLRSLKKELLDWRNQQPEHVFWPEGAQPLVEQLVAAVPDDAVPELTAESVSGKFTQILNSTNYADANNELTLGALSFKMYHPNELKIKAGETRLVIGVNKPDEYRVETDFEVLEGDLEGVIGLQTVLGRFEISQDVPGRQDVFFHGIEMRAKESRFSGAWTTALLEFNEDTMDESGSATAMFPQAFPGFRDFKVHDSDMTVSVGNRGSFVVVVPQ